MISFSYLSFVYERYTLHNSIQRVGPANKSLAYNEHAANVLGKTRQRQNHLSYPEANMTACTLNFPADGDQCFCHKGYSLLDYFTAWKTSFQFVCSHKSGAAMLRTEYVFLLHVTVGDNPANPKIAMPWKPGDKWQSRMKFEGVPTIWSSYKPTFTYSHNLSSHPFLALEIPHMLDHCIAVNGIEILIWPMQV